MTIENTLVRDEERILIDVTSCVLASIEMMGNTDYTAGSLDRHASLSSSYGLTSISMVSLIMQLESELGVSFTDDDLSFDNFYSIDAITKLIISKDQ